MWFKVKKITHPVNVINELNDNIMPTSSPMILLQDKWNYICKRNIGPETEYILLAMASTVINTNFKGKNRPKRALHSNIYAPRTPVISGMPSKLSALTGTTTFGNCHWKLCTICCHTRMRWYYWHFRDWRRRINRWHYLISLPRYPWQVSKKSKRQDQRCNQRGQIQHWIGKKY